MSKFIKLGACPHCGSKDNRAEYVNGYWCFGCSKYKSKNDVASLRSRLNKRLDNVNSHYPIHVVENIPPQAWKWLLKYNITPEEVKKYKIRWSPMDMLVLCMTKDYWQARNFGFGNQKYKSNGNKPCLLYGKGKTVILVEDVLSSIKIARTDDYSSIPLLGSSLSKEIEDKLSTYKAVYVWLDRDKAKNAVRITNRLREIGITSKVIVTELDPKEYNKQEINKWLKS